MQADFTTNGKNFRYDVSVLNNQYVVVLRSKIIRCKINILLVTIFFTPYYSSTQKWTQYAVEAGTQQGRWGVGRGTNERRTREEGKNLATGQAGRERKEKKRRKRRGSTAGHQPNKASQRCTQTGKAGSTPDRLRDSIIPVFHSFQKVFVGAGRELNGRMTGWPSCCGSGGSGRSAEP